MTGRKVKKRKKGDIIGANDLIRLNVHDWDSIDEYAFKNIKTYELKGYEPGAMAVLGLIATIFIIILLMLAFIYFFSHAGNTPTLDFCYIPEDPNFFKRACRDPTTAQSCVDTVRGSWKPVFDKCAYGINCSLPSERVDGCKCTLDEQCNGSCSSGICIS